MSDILNFKEIDIVNFYSPTEKNINKSIDKKYKFIDIEDDFSSQVFKEIYDIELDGYIPIILYPEKISAIVNDINNLNDFIDADCLFVLDAKSLVGDYGRAIKNLSKTLLENKIYNFIDKNRVSKKDINKFILKYKGYDEILERSIQSLNSAEVVEFHGRRVKPRRKILGIF